MAGKVWLDKKPETNRDWLAIIFASILFFTLLRSLNVVAGMTGKVLGILSPFAGGIVLAYVLDPFVRWMSHYVLKDKKNLRWIAILSAYVLFILLLVLLVWLVVPQVISSIGTLVTSLPGYIENVQGTLRYIQDTYGINLQGLILALDNYEQLMGKMYSMAVAASPEIVAYLQALVSNVVAVFTSVAGSVYMLASKDKLLHQLRTVVHALLPRKLAENTLRICHIANENFTGFYVGRVIDSAIVGSILLVILQILGISFAPLISVLVGVTNVIPFFGPFIGAIPSLLILLFVNPLQALEFLIIIICLQQVDGNFIGPKILGRSIGISALWVLFAVTLGANLFGLVGMVMGVPLFATLFGLGQELIQWCLDRRGVDSEGVRIARDDDLEAVHIRDDEDAGQNLSRD